MRTALFWVITQWVVVIFGYFTLEDGTDISSRNVGRKLPLLAA